MSTNGDTLSLRPRRRYRSYPLLLVFSVSLWLCGSSLSAQEKPPTITLAKDGKAVLNIFIVAEAPPALPKMPGRSTPRTAWTKPRTICAAACNE